MDMHIFFPGSNRPDGVFMIIPGGLNGYSFGKRIFFRAVDEEVPIENVGGGRRLGEDARFGIFEEDLELFLEAEGSGHLPSAAACVVCVSAGK